MSGKVKTPRFKSAFYDMGDSIQNLKSRATGDKELKELVRKAELIHKEIYNHLQKNYVWD